MIDLSRTAHCRARAARRFFLGLACAGGLAAAALAQAPAPADSKAPAAATVAPVLVTMETSLGPIVLELDAQKAPRTVANFVQYVKDGFYDETIFHRVIPGFMIQGGGYLGGLQEKPKRAAIAIESQNGLVNQRGTIAMARTGDPNSATSQFFINLVDNAGLDYPRPDGFGYTVFGKVVQGMEVVDQIAAAHTKARGAAFANLPEKPIFITKARLGK
jgi:peptidyl-prolyl cis-trans isomerase A (cyclophilin A)